MGKFADLLVILTVLFVLSLPFAYIYAKWSTCGWKGFFVECRITDCAQR